MVDLGVYGEHGVEAKVERVGTPSEAILVEYLQCIRDGLSDADIKTYIGADWGAFKKWLKLHPEAEEQIAKVGIEVKRGFLRNLQELTRSEAENVRMKAQLTLLEVTDSRFSKKGKKEGAQGFLTIKLPFDPNDVKMHYETKSATEDTAPGDAISTGGDQ